MSRRIVLLTLATTSLVVLAFLVPLLFLVRDVADAREMSQANAEAQTVAAAVGVGGPALDAVLAQVNSGSSRRTTVFRARCRARRADGPGRAGEADRRLAAGHHRRRPGRQGRLRAGPARPRDGGPRWYGPSCRTAR